MRSIVAVDWSAIKIAFVHGISSLVELAATHKVKHETVRKRALREGWQAERVKAEQIAVAAAAGQASTQRVKDLLAFNSDDLKIARAIRARIARRIAAETEEKPISLADLRILTSTAEAAQRMGRLALGASTDNVGLAGQGGEGPVEVTPVPMDAYLEARSKALSDF